MRRNCYIITRFFIKGFQEIVVIIDVIITGTWRMNAFCLSFCDHFLFSPPDFRFAANGGTKWVNKWNRIASPLSEIQICIYIKWKTNAYYTYFFVGIYPIIDLRNNSWGSNRNKLFSSVYNDLELFNNCITCDLIIPQCSNKLLWRSRLLLKSFLDQYVFYSSILVLAVAGLNDYLTILKANFV